MVLAELSTLAGGAGFKIKASMHLRNPCGYDLWFDWWHMPKTKSSTTDWLSRKTNAFPIPVLEAETFLSPMDAHLHRLQAQAKFRLRAKAQEKFMHTPCRARATNKP